MAYSEAAQKWREANRKTLAEKSRAYYKANRDKVKETNRKYILANHEKVLEFRRKYREAHREQISEYLRKWQQENRDKKSRIAKKWNMANRDKKAILQLNRRALIKGNGGSFTSEEEMTLFAAQEGLCVWCRNPLFNSFEKSYHRHHKRPISLGGTSYIENIELVHHECHKSKGAHKQQVDTWLTHID